MDAPSKMRTTEFSADATPSLRRRIKNYREVAAVVQTDLAARPFEWGKFQSLFNFEINGVFRELMNFEKEQIEKGEEDKAYKLKRIFVNRVRREFLHGEYIVWSLEKPFGYAGDYKIIDDIYLNSPHTLGFERLYDNYFQMSSISVAVRNRKEDFKKLILKVINENPEKPIRIMNLGSGPCRDLVELFETGWLRERDVVFDCYDADEKSHVYARRLLPSQKGIHFVKDNVVRMALKKDIESEIPERYDLIYSCGLFDYLDERVTVRLLGNLKKILKPGGRLAISDVRDKYSNPSVHFMEWVGDWNLRYREDELFRSLFLEAGFERENLEIGYEQQGIMQYVIARR